MNMTVKELIKQLQEIENQELEVYVSSFSDIGGWSEITSDFKVTVSEDGVTLED